MKEILTKQLRSQENYMKKEIIFKIKKSKIWKKKIINLLKNLNSIHFKDNQLLFKIINKY